MASIPVHCIPVDDTRCNIVIEQSALLEFATDPASLDSQKKGVIESLNANAMDAREMHSQIQRRMVGPKAKNAEDFADYLEDIRGSAGKRAHDGFAPPISLYCQDQLEYESLNGGAVRFGDACLLRLPVGTKLVAFDGDTQLAARHILQKRNSEVKGDFVSATLIHGESVDFARQAFCDVNKFGLKVPPDLALAMDKWDPVTRLSKLLMRNHKVFKVGRGTPTLKTMWTAGKAFFGGYGRARAKQAFRAEDIEGKEDLYFEWFDTVLRIFENRPTEDSFGVACSQPVMVGIGAFGHLVQFKHVMPLHDSVNSLKRVDWEQGEHWLGSASSISERKTDTGSIIIKGGHVNWDATYKALSDPESSLYHKIRHLKTRATG